VTGIGERLEDDWDAAVTKVRRITGNHYTSESPEQSQQEEP